MQYCRPTNIICWVRLTSYSTLLIMIKVVKNYFYFIGSDILLLHQNELDLNVRLPLNHKLHLLYIPVTSCSHSLFFYTVNGAANLSRDNITAVVCVCAICLKDLRRDLFKFTELSQRHCTCETWGCRSGGRTEPICCKPKITKSGIYNWADSTDRALFFIELGLIPCKASQALQSALYKTFT